MSARYRVKIGGREYEVEVGDLSSSPVEVTVDGVAYSVDLAGSVSPATVQATAPRPAPSRAPSSTPRPPSTPTSSTPTTTAGAITAMLPGRMISVDVQPGDRVTNGQPVAVIESMKMEQTIASPRDGTVSRVAVEPGDTVAYGQTLIEFE